jgi:pentapeptide MXKDX repeat protein
LEKERLEKDRLEKDRLEKERLEKERLEKDRLEKERLEKDRLEKDRLEKDRLEKERLEKDRLEKDRLEKDRLEKDRLEKDRLEKDRLEKERLEKDRLEKDRLEKDRLEKDRLEKERLEKDRLEKERLEKERLEIYLFNCFHINTLPFIISKYKQLYPDAIIKVYDNHTITEEDSGIIDSLDCTLIKYGSGDGDFDYTLLPDLYDTVWRNTDNRNAWVIIAPADTLVYITPAIIKMANQNNTGVIDIKQYSLVSKSTKKDLSDIQLKTINTAYEASGSRSVVCFNKTFPANITFDSSLGETTINSSNSNSEKCNAYAYRYLGLVFYVNRSRSLYTRQSRWREEKYEICAKKDINSISSELLSLPQTFHLSKFE